MQEALPAAVSPSLGKELLRWALCLLRASLSLCCSNRVTPCVSRGSLQRRKPGTQPLLAGAPQGLCVAADEQCLEPAAQKPRRALASPACSAPAVIGNTTARTPVPSPCPYLMMQAAGPSRRRRSPGAEQAAETQQAGGSHRAPGSCGAEKQV